MAFASHTVNLVDEHDGGLHFLRRSEQLTHALRTHADEHLFEIRSCRAEEGNTGLTGHSASKQRFACRTEHITNTNKTR
jgi:hypothetical protein